MSKKYSIRESKYTNIVDQLLFNRGIETEEEKNKFLNPDFDDDLHDPFLLPDMEKVVDRILFALENNEKVCIWSDYDADGIPGGALLHDFFKMVGFDNFINYIPSRHEEGYGVNSEGVEEIASLGVKLMITVDCGIRDVKEIDYAKSLGIEVIITDHHEPGESLPNAFSIVNHKIPGSKYPENTLCGSGIVWKLIEAILIKKRELLKGGKEKWLLDLVGIATLSDMVPILGENRVLSSFGLKVLRKTRRQGLRKLYQALKIKQDTLNEDDIGFLITPRINAASRMGRPHDAFDLLVVEDEASAEAVVKHLEKLNSERKGVVASIIREVKRTIKNRFESIGERSVIVVGNINWRPSLLGLVANSVAEEYKRPVFVWGRENSSIIKGSCRSDGSTDLIALMQSVSSSFLEFGGHKFSGGFSLSAEAVHTLEDRLIEASTHVLNNNNELLVDMEFRIKDVNIETANLINKLAPFGVGNEKPIFVFYNVIPEKIRKFGKEGNHISMIIRDGSATAQAISFFSNFDSWGDALKEGIVTNLVASIELSYFKSITPEVRLRIVDFF